MSSRKWQCRIEDILDAIAETKSFIAGATFEQFKTDRMTLKAVAADLMIIGEAANHIPDNVQEAHDDVRWAAVQDAQHPGRPSRYASTLRMYATMSSVAA